MARIIRVKINWSGFTGAPGYTNLHFEPAVEADPVTQGTVDDAVTKVDTFLNAFQPLFPPPVVTGVANTIEELDEQSGNIEKFWTGTPAAANAGTSATGIYAGGSGVCVNWLTGDVWNGRRVRGRTFMVPIGGDALTNDGTIDNTRLTAFRAAADGLRAEAGLSHLVVYRRPDPNLIIDGGAYRVTASNITDKLAQLRSRRD